MKEFLFFSPTTWSSTVRPSRFELPCHRERTGRHRENFVAALGREEHQGGACWCCTAAVRPKGTFSARSGIPRLRPPSPPLWHLPPSSLTADRAQTHARTGRSVANPYSLLPLSLWETHEQPCSNVHTIQLVAHPGILASNQ